MTSPKAEETTPQKKHAPYGKGGVDSLIAPKLPTEIQIADIKMRKSLPKNGTRQTAPSKKQTPIQEDVDEKEYTARIQRYQDACAVRKNTVEWTSIVYYYAGQKTNQSISYCTVPKAACTFWSRIFQFLHRANSSRPISNLLDITRFDVYYRPPVNLQEVSYNANQMANAMRFFFVRDPYARLLSAYVDEFILPQFMNWSIYGRRLAGQKGLKTRGGEGDKPCVKSLLPFQEFIRIFIRDKNPHWRPMHTVCDPCKLFPHFIGKQETFDRDVKYILNKVGLGTLFTSYSFKTYISDEIKQVVDFTYTFWDFKAYLRNCFDSVDVAERIWVTFQINGHVPSDMKFPFGEIRKLLKGIRAIAVVKDTVTKYIVAVNAHARMSHDQHRKQKRDMLVSMYKQLPSKVMEQLATMYDIDFNMFGYEKYPRDLFPWRYR